MIGTITSRVLIDCQHVLYNQCGNILVGDNVNFAIIGSVNCILFTMFKGMKRPRFIFRQLSLIGLERSILLLSHIVGCPTRQSSLAPLGTKRHCLTKSLQFKSCILPKKISTFVEFIPIFTTQVSGNVGLKTTKGQTIPPMHN